MGKWAVLLLLVWGVGWQSTAHAVNPYEGKSDYEILGIEPSQLVGLSETEAEDVIGKAYRRLALRFHPDHPETRGLDPDTRTKRFKKVSEAAENLRNQHGRGTGNPAAGSGGSRASGRARTNPYPQGNPFSFEEIFRNAQNVGFQLYREMESERAANMNPKSSFPRSATRATYSALMGGGFGDSDFYERFPGAEAAFVEFMRTHLDDLIDSQVSIPLSRDEVDRLEGALERSGNPSDLLKAVWNWKRSKGWEVGPDPCPYSALKEPPSVPLGLPSGGSAGPPKKPSQSRARRTPG